MAREDNPLPEEEIETLAIEFHIANRNPIPIQWDSRVDVDTITIINRKSYEVAPRSNAIFIRLVSRTD